MSLNVLKRNDRRGRVSRELLSAVRANVRRATGLTIDTRLLDEDEQVDLVRLTRLIAAGAESGAVRSDPRYLDKSDRTRYEQLVEKAAAKPNHFARMRKDRAQMRKIADLAAKANRPPARPRFEEQGCVVLPKAVHDDVGREGALWIEDVAVLWYVLSQLETGELLTPRAKFESDGDELALVIDRTYGLIAGAHNPEGNLQQWKASLDNLARIDWLAVETRGRDLVIRHGPRALEAIRMRESA
jgi:hypothetical protein